MPSTNAAETDYGVDAPAVMRSFFLIGAICLGFTFVLPSTIHLGRHVEIATRPTFLWPAFFFLAEGLFFLLYVKYGKFKHRDFMLNMHVWRGDEQILDVGCGRGLLLAAAAKHLTSGHATGIDIWSNEDMGDNSEAATLRNLQLEGVAQHCTLVSVGAQDMTFPDASFDVIVSNLCLHNIYSKSQWGYALNHIVRTLKPGGVALISDYKLTGEYADYFRHNGLEVSTK